VGDLVLRAFAEVAPEVLRRSLPDALFLGRRGLAHLRWREAMRRVVVIVVSVPLLVLGALLFVWGRNDVIGCGHGAWWLGTIAFLAIPVAGIALVLAFLGRRAGAWLGVVTSAAALLTALGGVRVAALGEEDWKRLRQDVSPAERAREERLRSLEPSCTIAGIEASALPLGLSLAAVIVGFRRRPPVP
jgi:hypothetical protein